MFEKAFILKSIIIVFEPSNQKNIYFGFKTYLSQLVAYHAAVRLKKTPAIS